MNRSRPVSIVLSGIIAVGWVLPPGVLGQPSSHTATYTARFQATWSAGTHPEGFPQGPHFSGLIGGTHNDEVSFWQVGGLATPGIKNMAELGAKQPLASEIGAAVTAQTAGEVISGGGIGRSPGSASVSFTVSQDHPLLTLVSMIAPSPDWFVGVSGLSLKENGDWVEEKVVALWPHDAGTDSGIIYTSPNQVTQPPVPISRIGTYPFEDTGTLGTFVLTRVDPAVVSPGSLLLNGGRFSVDVVWQTQDGTRGQGNPRQLTEDTGYFWFFEPQNIELLIKVLDACDTAERFWVFAGGLTDVEVDITIHDLETGDQRQYSNPSNTPFRPIQDTDAFATCP